jgi:hypothetical protein
MPDEMAILADATKGLLYPSESDEPFEAFRWPGTGDDPIKIAFALRGRNGPVTEQTASEFFADLEAGNDAARFKKLHALLATTLSSLRVFRIGEVEVDIYLIGKTKGGEWGGLHTKSVET